jgi:regulatory protein
MASRRRSQREPEEAGRDLGPHADPESVARTIVLTKLTAQARSRHELAEALAAKAVPAEVSTAVLDRFEEVGLVDDTAFAEAWIQSRQPSRGLSRRALRQELRRKGVGEEIIAESLDALDPDVELAAARRLVERKLRATRHLDATARIRRLTGVLARKGYPAGLAFRVVREAIAGEDGEGGPCGESTPDLDDGGFD